MRWVAGSGSYQLACACDEITIPEPGEILIPGLYLEATYYKGLLDNLGIQADFLHMGEAKGAAEPMTRTKMIPAVRANLTDMVDDLYNQMLESIIQSGRSRGMQSMDDELFRLANDGKIHPKDAYRKAKDKARFESMLAA